MCFSPVHVSPSCAAFRAAYDQAMDARITYIARTNHRSDSRRFGIKREDRFLHLHVIGKTGVGKSTLLATMAIQDLVGAGGFALIDPHGDLADLVYQRAQSLGLDRVIYLNATDPAQPYGYNPLRHIRADRIPLAASGLLEVFKKMWADAWGVRMEHILRNALYALLEQPNATLMDISRLFRDKAYRRTVAASLTNEPVRIFWEKEFDRYSLAYRADGVASIQNKVGGLLVTTIGLAAFSRADTVPERRRDFFVYVDEFQSFTTLAVANMLSELRKYRVGLTMAHQYLYQLEPEIRHAVLGNAGTLISFRLGAEDAPLVSRELLEKFDAGDLQRLDNRTFYIRLMIDGRPSQPFSATTGFPISDVPH